MNLSCLLHGLNISSRVLLFLLCIFSSSFPYLDATILNFVHELLDESLTCSAIRTIFRFGMRRKRYWWEMLCSPESTPHIHICHSVTLEMRRLKFLAVCLDLVKYGPKLKKFMSKETSGFEFRLRTLPLSSSSPNRRQQYWDFRKKKSISFMVSHEWPCGKPWRGDYYDKCKSWFTLKNHCLMTLLLLEEMGCFHCNSSSMSAGMWRAQSKMLLSSTVHRSKPGSIVLKPPSCCQSDHNSAGECSCNFSAVHISVKLRLSACI